MFDNEKSIEFPVKRTSEVVAALGSPRTVGKKCVYECIWLYNLVVPKKLKLTFLKFFWRFFSFHCQTYLNRTFSLRFFSSLCVNNVEKCWSFTYFNCDIRAAGMDSHRWSHIWRIVWWVNGEVMGGVKFEGSIALYRWDYF